MKRRALLRGGAGIALCASAAGCLETALSTANGEIVPRASESHLHDAAVPYVRGGLDADAADPYGVRLFTAPPGGDVVADGAPERDAESLRRTLETTDYDARFLVLAEARMSFDERFFLGTTPFVDAEWTGWRAASVPLVRSDADAVDAGDVGGADDLVCTALAAFEAKTAPERVTAEIYDAEGNRVAAPRS